MRAIPLALAMAAGLGASAPGLTFAAGETRPALAPSLAEQGPELLLPIACTPGTDCFVQSYADHDPGPEARDYLCREQSYQGHRGTDFRVPSLTEAATTQVLAAAAGRVKAVRNSMAEQTLGAIDLAAVSGRDCGNGLVIDHGGGWETQYCHLRAGSVLLKAGEAVEAGHPLGLVGLSGNTEFAHLHLSVRHHGAEVDPFSGPLGAGKCGAAAQSRWSAEAAASLPYTRSALINAGFARDAVSMDAIELGGIPAPAHKSPALVAYTRAINLREGDVLRLTLLGPDGETLADNTSETLDRHKAQWMMFTGRRLRGEAWPAGRYTGRFSVTNAGETVLTREFSIAL